MIRTPSAAYLVFPLAEVTVVPVAVVAVELAPFVIVVPSAVVAVDLVPSATVLPAAVDVFICVPAVCVMESPVITVLFVPVPRNVAEFIFTRSLFKEYVKSRSFWFTVRFSPAIN